MVVTSAGSRSFALLYERQLSVKRFIPGSVLLGCPLVSLRSKSCARLLIRTPGRNPMEKAALLEWFNEDV
jgi:hypothetical protein